MCGIAGFVQARPELPLDVVELQLRQLTHRGPDSSGFHAGRRAVVGQTRLAIIDLVTGDPPITNEDASIGVALNGEIYNFAALREELRRGGHHFKTEGDTEVIAHLAEDLEPAQLAASLEGMFAFATWDDRRERLVLARDRMGKKPLYYWASDGLLIFGSEIKALLAHPRVPRRVDVNMIPAYVTLGYAPTPGTFFEGIRSVPPGHVLVLERDGSVRLQCYWSPPIAGVEGVARADLPMEEAARQVRSLLTSAVERRLVSDVPLGAFLSGGIDSSAIVGILAGRSGPTVSTFTIGFEDSEGFDERPYAQAVAERFATEHTEFVVHPHAVDLVERLVEHHDQPFGDSSAIPTFLLSELTRKHVTVALSGDGGDELFAGYERFAAALLLHRCERVPETVRLALGRALDTLPPGALRGRVASVQRFAARMGMGLPETFLSLTAYGGEGARTALLGGRANDALASYSSVWRGSDGADLLDRLLDLNIRTYLLDDLLPKVDRMSMAHGLEIRSPFLDRELVEFALRLPPTTKVRGPYLKRVLKHAVRDLLPPEILRRRKRGFGIPIDRWFRTDLKPLVDATLGAPDARVRHHLDPGGLDRVLAEHERSSANHGNMLWTLLTLEVFLRREDASSHVAA